MRPRRRVPVAITLCLAPLLLALAAAPARAEPGDAERKTAAQALFDEARELTAKGQYAEACPKLTEAHRLDPTTGTKFYLADCLEHQGRLASAWAFYLEAADSARSAGKLDREKFARDRADALKPRLSKLSISVPAPARIAGLEVTRDGLALGEAQWGTAVPVDPGEHVIAASAPGRTRWEKRVAVKEEGRALAVQVPSLAVALAVTTKPVDAPAPPPRASARRIAGIAVGAAGAVGLGIGIGFGAVAASKKSGSDADGHCDAQSRCDATGTTLRHEGIAAATVSTAMFIVGGVALAGGVVLFLTAPRHTAPARAATSARIAFGPSGVSLSGSW